MEKITIGDKLTNIGLSNSEIIEALQALAPEIFSEGKVDFDLLKNVIEGEVSDSDMRYELNWHNKKRAMLIPRIPSLFTLRPLTDEGVDSEFTNNIIIEGDNQEVLKLLKKSYSGKVKMIYIDPPYNTGHDFVYEDNFTQPIEHYHKLVGEINEKGEHITTNHDKLGRFHSAWLNLMWPRLCLCRDLLKEDGVIFCSINDAEYHNLRHIMDDIFGIGSFLGTFIWKSRDQPDNRTLNGVSNDCEYIVCYGSRLRGRLKDRSRYKNPDNDPKGEWVSENMVGIATKARRPNLHYDLINPNTNVNYGCPKMGWRYQVSTMNKLIEEGCILWPKESTGRPREKKYWRDLKNDFTGFSTKIIGDSLYTKHGTDDLESLIEGRVFQFPKPINLIQQLIEQGTKDNDIVLDFFAGSGSTGHAVLKHNLENQKSNLRYILVQLPQYLNPKNKEQKAATDFLDSIGKPRNIAEITKERMRRAAAKIKEDNPDYEGDLGFKVFKQDSSNVKQWDGGSENLQKSLDDYVNQIKDGRTSMDILYEIMLKSGIQLTADIKEIEVGDNKVLSVDNCRLLACLDKEIKSEAVADLASKMVELKNANPDANCMVLFLDSAFADSSGKLNMSETLKQNGFGNIRSI